MAYTNCSFHPLFSLFVATDFLGGTDSWQNISRFEAPGNLPECSTFFLRLKQQQTVGLAMLCNWPNSIPSPIKLYSSSYSYFWHDWQMHKLYRIHRAAEASAVWLLHDCWGSWSGPVPCAACKSLPEVRHMVTSIWDITSHKPRDKPVPRRQTGTQIDLHIQLRQVQQSHQQCLGQTHPLHDCFIPRMRNWSTVPCYKWGLRWWPELLPSFPWILSQKAWRDDWLQCSDATNILYL